MIRENVQKLYKGDTLVLPIEVTDDNDLPVNITGGVLSFTAKLPADLWQPDNVAVLSTDVMVHTDPTKGKSLVMIGEEFTADVELGRYKYDVQLTLNGVVTTILVWDLEVLQSVTER